MKRILTVFSDFLDFMKNPSLHHRPQNRTSLPYWLVEPFKVPGSTDDGEQITLSADDLQHLDGPKLPQEDGDISIPSSAQNLLPEWK